MKVLYLHGFCMSGASSTANLLRKYLGEEHLVAPDLPPHPEGIDAIVRPLIVSESPDLIVGMSLGGAMAQRYLGLPKVLINPAFHASRSMEQMRGMHMRYKMLRQNPDDKGFVVTDELIAAVRKAEAEQFAQLTDYERQHTFGLFGRKDEVVRCDDEYAREYHHPPVYYDGIHQIDEESLRTKLLPLIERAIK